jgi:hypothetical protein
VNRLLPAVLLLAACAPAARNDVLSNSPSFRAKTMAVAATRGSRGKGGEISSELVKRLGASGIAASALEESDSVLAGAAVGLDSMNPRMLDEIRRATGADAVVFLSLEPDWSKLEIAAVDARTGDAVHRSTAKPRGAAFADAAEIAAAAARALAPLAAEHRAPRATRPDEPPVGELPLPGN